MALVPAWLSALLAWLRNLCAFLAGLVAAWSNSRMALVSFAVTPTGRVCPAHSAPHRAVSKLQRAVVQGSVLVVVVRAPVVVVLAVAAVVVVDVETVVLVVVGA